MDNKKPISSRATVLICLLGCIFALAMAAREWDAAERTANEAAALAAHRIKSKLRLELALQSANCDSVAAFFAASEYVSREEFHTFADRLVGPGSAVQAVEWVDFVHGDLRESWESARARQISEWRPSGKLQRAGDRGAFAPIVYVAPAVGNERAGGFDLFSEPRRRNALLRAASAGRCTATAPIRIVQDDSRALLIAKAVYGSPGLPPSGASELAGVQGWAVTVVRGEDIVSEALDDDAVGVSIYDVTELLGDEVQLYAGSTGDGAGPDVRRHSEHLEMCGRTWRIDYLYAGGQGWNAFRWTLLAGLLITALLTSHFNATRKIYNNELALREKNEEIRLRNREIRGFYHAVSHELKTPLASAREFASLLRDGVAGPVNDEQVEYGDYILESCDQMTRYINDMLDVTRMETGKFTLEREVSSVAEVVKQPACAAERMCRDKGIQFSLQLDAGLPDIDVDAQRIQQAISNLLTNAAKFTPPGGCVSLSVMRGSRAGDVMISVSDTGIGIEPSDQEWVFERLRQARTEDAARGVDGGGIGLGLAITKEIVQLHGGNISLESEPGFGTTFHILLPVAVATEASQTREMQTVRS